MVNVKNEMRKYNDRVTIIGEDLAKANLEQFLQAQNESKAL